MRQTCREGDKMSNYQQQVQQRQVYMDHAATTPVDPQVLEAMLPYFTDYYGNPSSIHRTGRRANVALEGARRAIGAVIGARTSEVIFTGSGSESDNTAVRGIALARRAATGATRIVTTPIEHQAVLATVQDLCARYGFALALLPVDGEARIDLAACEETLGDGRDVALVSVMLANNEVGAIQPLAEVGRLCRARGVPLHTDAVQAGGKLPLDVGALQVDALSAGAHKFYGPKGVGFLYLRGGTPFWPQQTGGSHEGGRRAGTENVPLIVGMAKALEVAEGEREQEMARQRALRDRLIDCVLEEVEGAVLIGPREARLANHASFVVRGADAEGMLIALDMAGIAASSGSACSSGAQQPSHVLAAMGITAADAAGALRLSLGRSNNGEDVAYVIGKLGEIVRRLSQS
jgi:cysteine desulfurase